MTMGEAMRAARKKAGMTQCKLSKISGVTRNNISEYENDHKSPNICTVEALADSLGISIDEYIGHEIKEVKRK